MKNIDLKKIYDESKLNWHSGFNESMMLVQMIPKWQGLDVLEIGCGEGHLASILRYAGAKNIDAIDYSDEQIKRAKSNYPHSKIYFSVKTVQVEPGRYDFIDYCNNFDVVDYGNY